MRPHPPAVKYVVLVLQLFCSLRRYVLVHALFSLWPPHRSIGTCRNSACRWTRS